MAFWTEASLEPKRQFRFKIEFGTGTGADGKGRSLKGKGSDINSDMFLAQSAERPTYTIKGDAAVHFLDKQFNFPGKITWNPIKIKFVDAIVGSNEEDQSSGVNVALRSYKYLLDAGWIMQGSTFEGINTGLSQTGALATINKKDAKTFVKIHVLDAKGASIEVWQLKNPFITNIALTGMDYAQDGILTAEYSFTYDWAECKVKNDGFNSAGR